MSGGRRGAGSTGQPWEEEEAVAPSRSPELRCYIYPPAGPGLGLSPVTQALQPARIRGDGTFLSKNNPPAAGERAGVEVTDWTAAPTALLTGEQPSRSAAPRDGEPARVATTPAPCPGVWGQSWEPESLAAGPSGSLGPGNGYNSVVRCCAWGPVAAQPSTHRPLLAVGILRGRSSFILPAVPSPRDLSLCQLGCGTGQAALQRQSVRWHSWAPWDMAAWDGALLYAGLLRGTAVPWDWGDRQGDGA